MARPFPMWASMIASAPAVARGSRRLRRVRARRYAARRRSHLAALLRSGRDSLQRSPRMRRIVAIAIATLLVLTVGWWWVRDSSLVGVQQVKIVGVRGPDAALIRTQLAQTARGMTTMDLDVARLKRAIAPYTVIASLTATTHFPHGVTIDVVQRLPVALLTGPAGPVNVAGDGTLLRGLVAPAAVPVLKVAALPAGARVTDSGLMERIGLLGAAPDALLARVDRVFVGTRGLEAVLRNGPTLYFGDATRAGAKWSAAARVLADSGSAGALYVDVRIPERPAAEVPGAASFTVAGAAAPGASSAATTAGPGLAGAVPPPTAGATGTGAGTGAGTGSTTTPGGVNGP
jgi:cell division protein FtsQ